MTRLLVLAALWSPMVVACCHDRVVSRPVVVRGPSCLVRPAPLAPPDAPVCGEAWSLYYVELLSWVEETQAACGEHERPVASVGRPDPGPAWWTRQPSGAVGE